MTYSGGATDEMWAISDGEIFDVTSAGAVGAAAVSTGLTNSRWEYTNVTTAGGNYLYAANGVDKPLLYNGSTWTAIDAVSSPAITGRDYHHPDAADACLRTECGSFKKTR
jgi:hypothetical protein